jgi:hypothetical protein
MTAARELIAFQPDFLPSLSDDLDTLRVIKATRTTSTPTPLEVDFRQSLRHRIELWNSVNPPARRLLQPQW